MCGKWKGWQKTNWKNNTSECYILHLLQGYLHLPPRRQLQLVILVPDIDVLPGNEIQQHLHPLDSRNTRTPVLLPALLEMALTGSVITNASAIGTQ